MRSAPAPVDAVIIPSGDAHQSEYVASCDERRAFLSGFTGSAGTALVLQDRALLWTDGRYFLQAEGQLSSEWTLMKSGEPGVPTMEDWLAEQLKMGQSVGVDANLMSGKAADALSKQLAAKGITLAPLSTNYADEIWSDRPAASRALVRFHPVELAGEAVVDKLNRVRAKLRITGAVAGVYSMLDEVCLLMLRIDDINELKYAINAF